MNRIIRGIAAALCAIAFATGSASAQPAAGEFRVHAIDVGTGLSILVEGADFTLLYDAGSQDDHGGGANNRVLAFLRLVRPDLTTIDHLVLSHPHRDHHEMLDSVLGAYRVRHVWDSGTMNDGCGYRAFLDAVAAEPGVVYHNARPGAGPNIVAFSAARNCHGRNRPAGRVTIPRGSPIAPPTTVSLGTGASMTILHANGNAGPSDRNDASVVARLDLGERRLLLTGDAEAGGRWPPSIPPTPNSTEGELLACCAAALRSDILIVGHHGSRTSSRRAFLDAVGAREFVISSGPFPYSGVVLPNNDVVNELEGRGTVWRTDIADAACRANPAKVGRDRTGAGGCDHVRITIDRTGRVTPSYFRASD